MKNPVSLAKAIMVNTGHIFLGAEGALDYAKQTNLELMPDTYFATPIQFDEFDKERKKQYQCIRDVAKEQIGQRMHQRMHGTVGAVALDMDGNLAAATSTGGTPNAKEGRIGDSSMIGVGSYADNRTCAVSGTGDGEYLIRGVVSYSISQVIKYKDVGAQNACEQIVSEENKDIKGDIGVTSIDKNGEVGIAFNSERLLRAWKKGNHPPVAKIYR